MYWSKAATMTGGVIAAPTFAFEGCPRKPMLAAGPGITLNVLLVTLGSPADVAVNANDPALVSVRPVNVATPPTAVTEVCPPSTAFGPVGEFGIEIVTVCV